MNRTTVEIASINNEIKGVLGAQPEIRQVQTELPNMDIGNRINIWVLPEVGADGIHMKQRILDVVRRELSRIERPDKLTLTLQGIGDYVPFKLDVRGVIGPRCDLLLSEVFNATRYFAIEAAAQRTKLNNALSSGQMSRFIREQTNNSMIDEMGMGLTLMQLTAIPETKRPYIHELTTAPLCPPEDVTVRLYPYSQQRKYLDFCRERRMVRKPESFAQRRPWLDIDIGKDG